MAEEMSAEKIFSQELGKANPDFEKLANLLKTNPGLIRSDRLVEKIFPRPKSATKVTKKSQKDKLKGTLGNIRISKMMNALRNAKKLKDAGLLSGADYNRFVNAKDPKTGETFATLTAKHAVIAYDKAGIDRSPKENLSPAGRAVFAKKAQQYAAALAEMQELGVSMEGVDRRGLDVAAIAAKGKVKNTNGFSPALVDGKPDEATSETRLADLPATIRQETAPAQIEQHANEQIRMPEKNPVNVQIEEKEEELEVGNKKPALKIDTPKKSLDVNVQTPQKTGDNENEATVEDAPEKDKGKGSDWDPERIKEQDIIDYMYNEWFLAGLSWAINGAGKLAYNGVAYLCDKGSDHWKGKKLKKHEIQAKDFKNSADQLLKSGDQRKATFNNKLDKRAENLQSMHADVLKNMGKTPQHWTSLDPNKQEDAALIKKFNDEYISDPKSFNARMKILSDFKNSQMMDLQKTAYGIATDMATAQYLHDKMKNSSDNLTDIKPEKLEKDLDKLIKRNYSSIMRSSLAVSQKIQKTYKNQKDGIAAGQKAAQEYLELLLKTNNTTVRALQTDLENGSFKVNGQEPQTDLKDALNRTTVLMEAGEAVYTAYRIEKERSGDNTVEPVGLYEYPVKNKENEGKNNALLSGTQLAGAALDEAIKGNENRKNNFESNGLVAKIKSKSKGKTYVNAVKKIENNADMLGIFNKYTGTQR